MSDQTNTANSLSAEFMVAGCTVKPADNTLLRNGETIHLEPKTMALLQLFAEHLGEVLSRQQIEESVWPHTVVGYDALTQTIAKLRRALDDNDPERRIIETVPKKGYRLRAGEQASKPECPPQGNSQEQADEGIGTRVLPALAVLPFTHPDQDEEMSYFGDGMTEDILFELASCPDLHVVARHSCFAYKNTQIAMSEIAANLGVDYIIEGSVRRSANRVRISAQLVETGSGRNVWGERFDEESDDLFALQDAVTAKIIGHVVGENGVLKRADHQRAWSKNTMSLDAYDYYLRVHDHIFRSSREDLLKAQRIALEGLQRFPNASLIKIKLGWTHLLSVRYGFGGDPETEGRQALRLANEGLADVSLHAFGQAVGYWLRANVHLWYSRDFQRAITDAEAAMEIAPKDADLLISVSLVYTYSGQPRKALELIAEASAYLPHPPPRFFCYRGWAHFHAGHAAEAVADAARINLPDFESLRLQAAAFASAGKVEEAARIAHQMREMNPTVSISKLTSVLPYRIRSDLEREVAGLKAAGIPE